MRKTHKFRNFLILMLLVAVVALGYYVYTETDMFIIKDVNFLGKSSLSDSELRTHLGLDEGLRYFETNPYDLLNTLKEHPKIKTGDVEKIFPDTLIVKVIERRPVIAVHYSGDYLLIDEDLVVIEVIGDPKDFYVVNGYYFENFKVGMRINDKNSDLLLNIINLVFLVDSTEFESTVTIRIVEDEIHLVFKEDFYVNFGDGDNIVEWFAETVSICQSYVGDGVSGMIDAKFDIMPIFEPFGK